MLLLEQRTNRRGLHHAHLVCIKAAQAVRGVGEDNRVFETSTVHSRGDEPGQLSSLGKHPRSVLRSTDDLSAFGISARYAGASEVSA
jgi:hypothetical protein